MAQSHSVREFESFGALRAAAPALRLGDHPETGANIFYTLPWFENLAQTALDRSGQLKLLLIESSGQEPPACLPLLYHQKSQQLSSLSNFYSSLFGPICSEQTTSCQWVAAIRHLKSSAYPISTINLNPLDTASSFYTDLTQALESEGFWADPYFCFGNWTLDVAGRTSDEFLNSIPPKLRNTIDRGKNKLTRAGPWTIRIDGGSGAELDLAINHFKAVYAQSWKGAEDYPDFIEGLCRTAAHQGWLRLGVLSLNQQPVAAQLWLVYQKTASIYKLAYDAAYTRFSPGSVLTAAMFKHAIDCDHVLEVDYLTGDDAYKQDWMSHRRQRFGLIAFNKKRTRGILAAGRHYLPKWLKAVCKTRSARPDR